MSSDQEPLPAIADPAEAIPPSARARQGVERLIGALRWELAKAGWTAKAASQRLGYAPSYLTKVFRGRLPLKMEVVFGLLRLFGKEPLFFFGGLFPLSEPTTTGALSSGFDLSSAIARLVALADAQALEIPAVQWVALARQGLRTSVRTAGWKLRAVSRALDLKADGLGNALRRRSALTAYHLLGTLEVLGRSPGAFFAEICRPADEEMPWLRVVELAERVAKAAREKAAGQQPAAPGASPSRSPGGGGRN